MNKAQFNKYLQRDKHCYHCGATDEMLIPHHRQNRGMGGNKKNKNQPSNILAVCAVLNGAMESDTKTYFEALENGWKVRQHQDPAQVPVFDAVDGIWYLFDDQHNRHILKDVQKQKDETNADHSRKL